MCGWTRDKGENEHYRLPKTEGKNIENRRGKADIARIDVENVGEGDEIKRVVPKGSRWQILKRNHDDVDHYGFKKTLERIKKQYWFSRMRRFVKKYASACLECTHHKPPGGQHEGKLYPIEKQVAQGILSTVINDILNLTPLNELDTIREEASERIETQQLKDADRFNKRRKRSRKYKVLEHDRYVVEDAPLSRKSGRRYEGIVTVDKMQSWMSFDRNFDDSTDDDTSNDNDDDVNNVDDINSDDDRRRGHRRRSKVRSSTPTPEGHEIKNISSTEVPVARRGDYSDTQEGKGRKRKLRSKKEKHKTHEHYDPPLKSYESSFVEMPKDLYQAHLRPGVIFRIHMSEAILKMQYRNYGEDKDESVIEADVEYLRLTRKVINDEITKFEDLKWLVGWFNNRSELIQEHMCNTRYYSVGIPPTMFTHSEEYMKRMCLFDNVYIDHIPYVVGEDGSLMAAVAPPVLHCDAATCTSVPFIDSIMFDERLSRTNVRTVTRCQASCRMHCRNDPDCLKRCSDRCLRAD
ncbi:unnamed protein product [Euphydryas editha]|uniref:Integrase zinc-binding domain-containing protein n=1 Tax=Euphydryas editha TaxID=104508 RepID=A0AAU9UQP6_EUPED|nr:unnamed protein product [Euphydryas editha]